MPHLAKLKFSDKQRSQVKMTVEERLRHKLIDRLKEQKELAEADLSGNALVKTRYKMIKDEETGETKRVQVPRLMRRWWWQNETDVVLLELRYGNKPIAIADNKSTIEVGPMDKLPDRQIKYESTAFQFGNSSVPK
jgi:hypothetical protein